MKAEIREMLGKTAYEATVRHLGGSMRKWHELEESVQELHRIEAETVVKKLAEVLLPVLQLVLSESDVKRLLEQLSGGAE